MHDAGVLTICKIIEYAKNGAMPINKLEPISDHFFEERTVGYGRQYAAFGVNERVDILARIWRVDYVEISMCVLINDVQYRIGNFQHLKDEDGLYVTDLSLERLGFFYEISRTT